MAGSQKREPRRFLSLAVLLVVFGGGWGWFASAANHGLIPFSPYVSQIAGTAWGWVLVGCLGCAAYSRWRPSAALSAVMMVSAVVVYYLSDLSLGVYRTLGSGAAWGDLVLDVITYTVFAVVAALGLATLAVVARGRGRLATPALVVVPLFLAWGSYSRATDALVSGGAQAVIGTNYVVAGVGLCAAFTLAAAGAFRAIRSTAVHRHRAESVVSVRGGR